MNRKFFLILPLLVIVLFILAYLPVWQSLIKTWSGSEDYSHGFFIVPISLYLIWQKRDILSKLPAKGSVWGLIIVLLSLFIYVFAEFTAIKTLASLSLIPVVSGTVIYLWGFRVFWELIFPIGFLIFMIPVPSQIYSALTIPLQLLVSKTAVLLSTLFGVPVYREGNVIHLADRTLQVVRACSGMRSIMTLLTLSAVFGYVTLKSNLLRTLLFFSGIVVAIIVNIFRVLLMLLAFNYFDIDLTTGSYHVFLGVLVFMLALGILFGLKGLLALWDRSEI